MRVLFGTTTKRKNSTLIPSVTADMGDCVLKSPCSVVSPTIEVQTSEWPDYNYCYIPLFHRYYFIYDVVSDFDGIWSLSCNVDVLATYKTAILNTNAYVERAEKYYNSAIRDGAVVPTANFTVTQQDKVELPQLDRSAGMYVLGIAGINDGENGFVGQYAMNASQFKSFSLNFFNDSVLEKMSKYTSNPISYIATAIWVPLNISICSTGLSNIFFGNVNADVSFPYAKTLVSGHTEFTVTCPYFTENPVTHTRNYSDYRNLPPYTETDLILPGVGMIALDTSNLLGDGGSEIRIDVEYDISPITGDITYYLRNANSMNQIFMIISGNFAVSLPVSGITRDYIGEKSATVSAITSGLYAAAGIAQMAAGNGIGPITSGAVTLAAGIQGMANASLANMRSQQYTTTIKGSMGGFASDYINDGIQIIQRKYDLSGTPLAIGYPLYDTCKLSMFEGYVKCSGAYIGVPATDYEHDSLIALVNGGFYVE